MTPAARPRRYWVALAACAVAALGLSPIIGGQPHAVAVDGPDVGGLAVHNPTSGDVRPPDVRTPIVVELRSESWAKYVDLIIRVLAVLLAWLTGQPPKSPAPTDKRPLR